MKGWWGMTCFKVAKVEDMHGVGGMSVDVVGDGKKTFCVTVSHLAGGFAMHMHFTPDQSRQLRQALEDAEAKAEILTAAV